MYLTCIFIDYDLNIHQSINQTVKDRIENFRYTKMVVRNPMQSYKSHYILICEHTWHHALWT